MEQGFRIQEQSRSMKQLWCLVDSLFPPTASCPTSVKVHFRRVAVSPGRRVVPLRMVPSVKLPAAGSS
jgi:hypothetical protein